MSVSLRFLPAVAVRADGQPQVLIGRAAAGADGQPQVLSKGALREREYMQCNMLQHVTTLSGVRGTGGVVPVLWYVYKEIDSLIQQRQFFSRGGRSAPCAPVATLEQTL